MSTLSPALTELAAAAGCTLSARVMDHGLARQRLLSQFRAGAVPRSSVSDATPQLIASAEVLGRTAERKCPVCGRPDLRESVWIHGAVLKEKSGTARSVREINGVIEDFVRGCAPHAGGDAPEFSIHTVEVCTSCRWNFLVREEAIVMTASTTGPGCN